MGLFASFLNSTNSRRASQLGHHIAQRCCAAVWSKVHQQAIAMQPAEARGYLRAHAATALRGEVATTLASQKIPPSLHARVAEIAKEALVETLLREVMRVQKTKTHRRLAA